MAAPINPILTLYADKQSNEGYSSVNHMTKGFLHQSKMLTPAVTHLYYSHSEFGSKNFPLMFLTEGMNKIKYQGIGSIEYKQPVIGKPKKTSMLVETSYTDGEKVGRGYAEFELVFADRLFMKSQILYSSDKNIQVRVQSKPIARGNNWVYRVKLLTHDAKAYVPHRLLTKGTKWGRGIPKVGIEGSEGVEHRSFTPGMMTNQLSIVRDTYKISGNVEEKVMVLEIQAGGKTYKYWCEWELYLRGLEWKEKCEDDLWYSLYNRDSNGEVHERDEDSGEIVPSGAGALQQITNEDTYSFMTEAKLRQIVRDAFYNASNGSKKVIDVYTGIGGLEEVDNAIKNDAKGFGFIDSSDKFIEGNGNNLVYGAYFKTFRHVDGHVINFRHLPLLEEGSIAQVSPRHPITGLSMESYSMYFMDMSTYEGEQNVQYIAETGRENINFIVPGVKVPKGYDPSVFRAHGKDASSIHWMKSQGVHIKRPTNCFKVFCTLS